MRSGTGWLGNIRNCFGTLMNLTNLLPVILAWLIVIVILATAVVVAVALDSGDIVQIVGWGLAANYIYFNPDATYVEVA